ncbi:MAG: flagellar protein export ATPase FliI [Clostridia bacterium]|nr:flagellar protein export ATPase FliI [Clostridia bacterium]
MSIARLDAAKYIHKVKDISTYRYLGKVARVVGLTIEASGINASIGEICIIQVEKREEEDIVAEVVGFRDGYALLMPLGDLKGIAPGCRVLPLGKSHQVMMGEELLGQVLDGLGRPLDGVEGIPERRFTVHNDPPNPMERKTIDEKLETGIKAIDMFTTCGRGQRVGIFAGSGVGKSTLLGMIARCCVADVNVVALIGERGREIKDFLHRDLGEEGLKKSVVVTATSDQPPLVRIKGAFVATAIAEYFRDQGKDVMLMMDSVTRFAAAQREVGLAVGEPPATRGYTPSVFALLPKLLERAGRSNKGSITGLYTVLVEADDMNEPIADAVRGILDGHIVLSRRLAAQNHFPAVDILQSISRLMPDIIDKRQSKLVQIAREALATYEEAKDLVNIGAYEKGSNPEIDNSIKLHSGIMEFLKQGVDDHIPMDEALDEFEAVIKAVVDVGGPGVN